MWVCAEHWPTNAGARQLRKPAPTTRRCFRQERYEAVAVAFVKLAHALGNALNSNVQSISLAALWPRSRAQAHYEARQAAIDYDKGGEAQRRSKAMVTKFEAELSKEGSFNEALQLRLNQVQRCCRLLGDPLPP